MLFNKISDSKQIVLVIDTTLDIARDYYLKAGTLKDKQGNIYHDEITQFTVSENPDTSRPKVIRTVPQEGERTDFVNDSIMFYFDDAFDTVKAMTGIMLSDTSLNKIKYSVNFPDNATLILKPSGRLKSGEVYLIKFDLSKFEDAAGNKVDTIYTYRFITINEIDFTGASGTIVNVPLTDNPYVILQGTDNNGKKYAQYLQKGSKFEFNRVFPGKYLLWCYLDRDSSQTYDRGNPYPFKPSEEFSFYPDTLNLRARWGQMDILYNFK